MQFSRKVLVVTTLVSLALQSLAVTADDLSTSTSNFYWDDSNAA
jgi:hypothetical protein